MMQTQVSIEEFLDLDEKKELLRFITAGSVDDGKSTLIGRLLYDSKSLYEDQIESLNKDSRKHGRNREQIDYSLLLDGLKAEREQGITIDVAYRYFSTNRRKFIIADTPGHEQYTRNMATGASTADLAIILVDARSGVITQTKRHTYIAALWGIKNIVLAVNKMDLVGYDKSVFEKTIAEYMQIAESLDINVECIPLSALEGDNVVDRSEKMPWYKGDSLLQYLETVRIDHGMDLHSLRLPIQYVSRNGDFRGLCGKMAGGTIAEGEEIVILPSAKRSRVEKIYLGDAPAYEVFSPQSVMVKLRDQVDVSRGDILVRADSLPYVGKHLDTMLIWLDEQPMNRSKDYLLKHTARTTRCTIGNIEYKTDINTMAHRRTDNAPLSMNQIGRVGIQTSAELFFDTYFSNRATGAFIIIDPISHFTCAAGVILDRGDNGDRAIDRYNDDNIDAWKATESSQADCRIVELSLEELGISPEEYHVAKKICEKLKAAGITVELN